MNKVAAIVLAAGKGTRMKSDLSKVMHPLVGQPMIAFPLQIARNSGVERIVVVVGHQAAAVQSYCNSFSDTQCVLQAEQNGTGHAVGCTREVLQSFSGTVLILCGDTPLLTSETIQKLLLHHKNQKSVLTVLTARVPDPFGYGRIVRDLSGNLQRIVEQKDANESEKAIFEINSGIYCMESEFLFSNIDSISSNNAQGELYLTDLVSIAIQKQLNCSALCSDNADEIIGVNDRAQLAAAAAILRTRINKEIMLSGVSLIDPAQTYIDAGVFIGTDTTIHPNCHISGKTVIGSSCTIENSVSIHDCSIGSQCHIKASSVLENSQLFDHVAVGPMAHLRPGSVLHNGVKIGNFVETKKIIMAEGSKASHLTYLGDAEIGRDVNIGCGTITCNYDGVNKHKTVIGDDVFIGSDVQLVAPVTIGRNSLVAAGTTVTTDVPPDSLAISRVPQTNKEGWRLKQKGKK